MRVMYVNKKTALLGLLLVVFMLVAGYSLAAHTAWKVREPVKTVPEGERTVKGQQQTDLLTVLPVVPDVTAQKFFVDCRLARDRICSQQMETLKEIAGQSNSSGEVRDSAQRGLMQLAENMARETELENLVKARGYRDAAVMILPHSATVIIQAQSVTPAEVEQIRSLIAKTTELNAGNIFVIPKT